MTVERLTSATRAPERTFVPRAARAAARIAACASLAALAALAACASPPSRFYTLGGGGAAASAPSPANPALFIEVAPVDVPSQVAKNQMVVQASASRVDVLEQERWSSLPGDEIRRALSGDLTRRLDTIDVSGAAYPGGVPVYRISVNVQRFESWPASRAVLDAVWSVRAVGTNAVLTCHTLAAEPVGPGFDALVDGHRRAVDRMSAEIAAGVRALAAARPAPGSAASGGAGTRALSTACPAAQPESAAGAGAPAGG